MNSDPSSDSSGDEIDPRLKEAIDTNFINNDLYKNLNQTSDITKKKTEIVQQEQIKLPSLRKTLLTDDEFDVLNVTPEFQNYVAKNLMRILDDKLNMYLPSNNVPQNKITTDGIKLFKSSQVILQDNEDYCEECVNNSQRKKLTKPDIDIKDLKSIVVSPEEVLSKKETQAWSKRTKKKPFLYKQLPNGKLELVESKFGSIM